MQDVIVLIYCYRNDFFYIVEKQWIRKEERRVLISHETLGFFLLH